MGIILVAADFSKELTTAVLWLRDREIDIRCIRFRPYLDNATIMVDVQQILPLPEAHDYQVQLREKEQQGRRQRAERYDIRQKFWEGVVAIAREHQTRHANIKPGHYGWIGASSGVRGLNLNYVIGQEQGAVELYIDRGDGTENKQIFDTLCANKDAIERSFGGSLRWERLDAKRACRIKHVVDLGGYRSLESLWPQIQEAMVEDMIRLEAALPTARDPLLAAVSAAAVVVGTPVGPGPPSVPPTTASGNPTIFSGSISLPPDPSPLRLLSWGGRAARGGPVDTLSVQSVPGGVAYTPLSTAVSHLGGLLFVAT